MQCGVIRLLGGWESAEPSPSSQQGPHPYSQCQPQREPRSAKDCQVYPKGVSDTRLSARTQCVTYGRCAGANARIGSGAGYRCGTDTQSEEKVIPPHDWMLARPDDDRYADADRYAKQKAYGLAESGGQALDSGKK